MKAIWMLLGLCLVEAGLVLACAAHQTAPQTTAIPRVVLSAAVPGSYWFCVEDEYLARVRCVMTVQELRQWIAAQRAAN